MKKYQGEDIFFSLKFNSDESGALSDFSGADNVIVYAYTAQNYIVKFAMVPAIGYSDLILSVDNMTLTGVIDSEYTKSMLGQIVLEIMIEVPNQDVVDGKENLIKKVFSGIFLTASNIKTEA